MQVNVVDRSSGNQINITETFADGNSVAIGRVYGNRYEVTVTTRTNDGQELRELVSGMVREDGSQYNVDRKTLSYRPSYATPQPEQNQDYYQSVNSYQSVNGYASVQLVQPKRNWSY